MGNKPQVSLFYFRMSNICVRFYFRVIIFIQNENLSENVGGIDLEEYLGRVRDVKLGDKVVRTSYIPERKPKAIEYIKTLFVTWVFDESF